MDLSIVIPCYNEFETVPRIQREFLPVVVELAKTHSLEVIFVDDGSTDNTWQTLRDTFGNIKDLKGVIRFERHEVNRGLGAALRTGFAAARGQVVVTTDSDGTYKFSEIPVLLSYLTPDVDVVTASPYHPAGSVMDVPGYRLILSRGSSTLYRLLADWSVHTYTALFRAYRCEVIQQVPFESNGFLAGTELLLNAMRMGYRVAEYPAVLHSRTFGESKVKLARTIQDHLGFQMCARLPWHPYGTVIQGTGDSVYLYTEHKKRLFPSAEIFLSHGYQWQQIVHISDSDLAGIPNGPPMTFRDGTLVKGTGDTVYVIEHSKKRAICSASVFEDLGYRWKDIVTIPDSMLSSIDTGTSLCSTDKHPDGTLVKSSASDAVYLLEAGKKRLFPSVQAFLSWGRNWEQIIIISESELASYPSGSSIVPQKSFYFEGKELACAEAKMLPEFKLSQALSTVFFWVLNKSGI